MKFTIIPEDNLVIVDGRAITGVSMVGLPPDLHAVQYDDKTGVAEEEWDGEKVNTAFKGTVKYQPILDRWLSLANAIDNPPPPTKKEALATEINKIKAAFSIAVTQPIKYEGNTYERDYVAIALTAASCSASAPGFPIPTPDGMWTTTTYLEDGITPFRVAFTCGEFLSFCEAVMRDRAQLMRSKQGDEVVVKKIAANPGKTAIDIKLRR